MLYVREGDVEKLLNIDDAIDLVREGFRLQAEGKAVNTPRSRVRTKQGTLNMMGATIDEKWYSGVKTYYGNAEDAHFLFVMYSTADTRPVAIIEASRMGQVRTGAASAVATDMLARANARVLGCIGTGYQAETQVEAITRVRNIDQLLVRGRSADNTGRFVERMRNLVQEVKQVSEEEMAAADILVTVTTSRHPVIRDKNIGESAHINAIGANRRESTELERETVCSARVLAVDSLEQARIESGDLMQAVESGCLDYDDVNELSRGFSGGFKENRKSTRNRTLFKSLGIAIEDLIVAEFVYRKARETGMGKEI